MRCKSFFNLVPEPGNVPEPHTEENFWRSDSKMTPKATEPKFSIEEVAKILGGLHPTTVLRLLQKRKLGYYQFGSRKMVGQSHLDNYVSLAEREAKAKSIH